MYGRLAPYVFNRFMPASLSLQRARILWLKCMCNLCKNKPVYCWCKKTVQKIFYSIFFCLVLTCFFNNVFQLVLTLSCGIFAFKTMVINVKYITQILKHFGEWRRIRCNSHLCNFWRRCQWRCRVQLHWRLVQNFRVWSALWSRDKVTNIKVAMIELSRSSAVSLALW